MAKTIRLPPHVDLILDQIAEGSHISKTETVRQAIILLDGILRGHTPPEALARSARVNFGRQEQGSV